MLADLYVTSVLVRIYLYSYFTAMKSFKSYYYINLNVHLCI